MDFPGPQLLQELFARSAAGFAFLSDDFRLLWVNPKWEKIFGYSFQYLSEHKWLHLWDQKFPQLPSRRLLRWFRIKLASSQKEKGVRLRFEGLPRLHVYFYSIENKGQRYIAVMVYETLDAREYHPERGEKHHYHENLASDINLARRVQKSINHFIIDFIEGRFFEYSFQSLFFPVAVLSGDLINMKQVNRRYSTLFLGDGRGHGVSAALYSSLIYSYMNVILKKISKGRTDIGRLMGSINNIACADFLEMGEVYFFSGVLGLIDGNGRTIDIVNAGHPPVFRVRGKKIIRLKSSGPVVGVLPKATFASRRYDLKDGDYFLFYTDGLYDIEPPGETPMFDKWLHQYICNFLEQGKELVHLLEELRTNIKEAQKKGLVTDDISLVAMSVREKPSR